MLCLILTCHIHLEQDIFTVLRETKTGEANEPVQNTNIGYIHQIYSKYQPPECATELAGEVTMFANFVSFSNFRRRQIWHFD